MRIEELIEAFARDHKDFNHNPNPDAKPEEKAFYLIAAVDEDCDFVRNFNRAHSPCIAYSNLADAEVKNGQVRMARTIYFMMKAKGNLAKTQKQDDEQAFRIREAINEYILEFVAWLQYQKRKASSPSDIPSISYDSIDWGGIPMRYNGWWVVGLSFYEVIELRRCLVREHFQSGLR